MLYHAWQNHRLYRRGGLAGRQYVLLSYNHQQSERTNIWKKIYLIYFKISVVIFIQRVEQGTVWSSTQMHVHSTCIICIGRFHVLTTACYIYLSLSNEIEQTKKRETTTTSNESMHFLTQTRRGVSKDDRIRIAIGPLAALPADS